MHCSYTDSISPGPSVRCTLKAASITLVAIRSVSIGIGSGTQLPSYVVVVVPSWFLEMYLVPRYLGRVASSACVAQPLVEMRWA